MSNGNVATLQPITSTERAVEVARRPRFKPARMYRALQRRLKDTSEERDAICSAVIFAASDPESRWFMDAVELVLRGDPDLRRLLKEDGSAALAASAPRIVILGPQSDVTTAPVTTCVEVEAQYTQPGATYCALSEASPSPTKGDEVRELREQVAALTVLVAQLVAQRAPSA